MGRLTIGTDAIAFDDRVLAHIEAVMVAKLRRREPFVFTWAVDVSLGGGRISTWVNPSTTWSIRFDDRLPASLNRTWLEALMSTANSPGGLRLVPEPSTGDNAAEKDDSVAAES